ncbi:hypothetical protein E4X58_20820 [Salmonella enterica]|nr:hypothetical protein [Salmonella enterica]EAO4178693.1 hypothetical protein [Salmonella enterica]EAT7397485.1 hypothetical protein [Salmonella enterica]EAV2292604.1 hypothetical protein [Salmonella enterica]
MFNLAEAQRFELWNPFGSPVFKTGKIILNIKQIYTLRRIYQKIMLYVNQIDTRSFVSVFFCFYAIPSPYTTPAIGTYPVATGADILPFRYPPAGLHCCQFLLCSLPCTVPASNPLMELAASRAR